ncbi:hypothetical protein EJ05DRAFT_22975 [Pseudovirgaria hyperparasitica]|uniref:NOT2/NOT3/NOT5 C-terminal domain-containing protein n=1 Tax=Pseudovirgaria hyperparasitica TaxID=470096 RepID=A0A6A6WLF7_9PEZI|nr:uncharacterized protein EJ05DRAFT_22975 [Pseudovirgaria hyperparasitica]KAF2763003.1 hypothetical protein EJ05DRAFT_22975 [Pseudovirgaria hyperparasitica]
MNRTGPGPQSMRAIPGNVYGAPQPNGSRGPLLGSGRLQNGKLSGGNNNSGWGFGGMPMGGAPGLSSGQSRTNFAQTIGGNQSQAPLDLSEFPSLGGAPQSQQQQSSSQLWGANPSLRMSQHTPVQRPQGQNAQSSVQQVQQHDTAPHDEHQSSSRFRSSGEDFRFGAQGSIGQLAGGSQPQTGNVEEFPPLGGAGGNGDMLQERRSVIGQGSEFGGSSSPFPNLGQSRNGLSSPSDSQHERSIASAVGDSRGAGTRPHTDDRNGLSRALQGASGMQLFGAQGAPLGLPFRNTGYRDPAQQPIGARSQQYPLDQSFGPDNLDQETVPARHKRLTDMTESERFGLPGLLAMISEHGPDHSALAAGQDLTALGLELNRPDNSPLYPTFGSPFSDVTRPVIPDFSLPPAYTVNNVPPLSQKMSSFSPETLLAIFYQFPRDIMQEFAAGELYNRDWRWHKGQRQWMMKDPDLPAPQRISDKHENGWYIFFDVMNWRKERRQFELNYDDLDQRHAQQSPAAPM